MKYRSDDDFRKALEDRIRQRERTQGEPLVRLRKRLAFERCLVRLQKKKDSPWILKGGVALELRLEQKARMTKDLDLGMSPILDERKEWSYAEVARMLRQDLAQEDIDRFVFLVHESNEQDTIAPGIRAYRFNVEVRLAGRTFEKIQVDVGLGEPLVPPFDDLEGSDLLGFAGIPRPMIRTTSRAQHFAEKCHAITRPRDDRINTRVKDLVDVMLLMDMGLPRPTLVKKTVKQIFDARQTHAIPRIIEVPSGTWASSFTAMAMDIGLAQTNVEDAASRFNDYWSGLFGK